MTSISMSKHDSVDKPKLRAAQATKEALPVHATIRTATFGQMVRSKLNMRRKGGAAVGELAALIKAFGLLQNLVGFQQPADGRATGPIEIVAGGRRLAAVGLLIAAGELPDDFAIPYLLVTEREAIALSLAENLGREPMHPADVVDCMRELVERGASPDDIAFSFGVDALTVKRRLKLAHVSPRLFALYRNDEICTEQMKAFAASDDHAVQEQVWDSLDPWSRKQPHAIRRLLLANRINIATDRVAAFVGRAAYEKAGGEVARDLFSELDEGFVQDACLLERLALAKLERIAAPLRDQGAHWTDILVRVEPSALAEYGKVRRARSVPTELQKAEIAELDEKMAALSDAATADSHAMNGDESIEAVEEQGQKLQQQLAALRDRRAKLDEALQQDLASDLALAGVVVTIDVDGKAQVLRGMIRPADRCKMAKAGRACALLEAGVARKVRSIHSERLVHLLASHRTAALAAELLARTDIALVVLAHALVKGMFDPMDYATGLAHISHSSPTLAEEAKSSAAGAVLAEKVASWKERARRERTECSLFAWLLTLESSALLDLMAVAVASTLDTASMGEKPTAAFLELAHTLDLDMHRWWKPTAANYFAHVTKDRILEVVGTEVSKEAAMPLAQLQKGACAEAAELALADKTWLPAAFPR